MSMIANWKYRAFAIGILMSGGIMETMSAAEPAAAARAGKADWSAAQATGEPDTPGAGDIVTAWASATQDGKREWLICEYEEFQRPTAVVVHETYHPGAIDKVSVFNDDGEETPVWKGKDPTGPDQPRGVSVIPIRVDFEVKKIKIYINSPAVPGWNEIDAVGLRGADGKTQWAKQVEASSTYGANAGNAPVVAVAPAPADQQRLLRLEQEVKELKEQMRELKRLRAEVKELRALLKKSAPDGKSPADEKE